MQPVDPLIAHTKRCISDTLSRAYREKTEGAQHGHSEIRALESISHEHISVTKKKRDEFRDKVSIYDETQALIKILRKGWPARVRCPAEALPYYDERSSLIEAYGHVRTEPPHEINMPDQVPQRTDHTETATPPVPRRSIRNRQPPKWQNDYEL